MIRYDITFSYIDIVCACTVVKNMASSLKLSKSKLQFFLQVPGKNVSMLIFNKLKGVCRSVKQ